MVIKVKINNASVYRSLSSCQLYKFSNLFFMLEKWAKQSHSIVTVIFQIFIINFLLLFFFRRKKADNFCD